MQDVGTGESQERSGDGAQVKVTVVVAVYNPGNDIDELLLSIDRQSLRPDEFEVIFADDNSTDGSRERLIGWAESRPHVRVLHNTLNSGWPGRPRNLAIEAATGEFLFFADNDDKFASRGLEWMYDYATQCDADVVIAKEVGVGRMVNRPIFRENIADAKLGRDPVLGLLTPHKLVRTSMVREHGIWFPEGRVRLEDHYFVVSCYFAARRIAVLADHACYYWMRRAAEGNNASSAVYEPAIYFRAVERALEVVEANTEPGPLRDQLYANWYDRKMMAALHGHTFLKRSPTHQEDVFAQVRRLSARFGLGTAQWPWLGAVDRMSSHFVMNDSIEGLRSFGAVTRGVTSRVTVEEMSFSEDDRLRLRLHGELIYSDGTPVRTVREGEAVYWDTSDLTTDLDLPRIDVADLLAGIELDVMVRTRATGDVDVAQSTRETIEDSGFAVRSDVDIDLGRIARRHPNGAYIDLSSWLQGAGWNSERRIPVPERTLPGRRIVGNLMVQPYATKTHGNLSIYAKRLTRPPKPWIEELPTTGELTSTGAPDREPTGPAEPTTAELLRAVAGVFKRRTRSRLRDVRKRSRSSAANRRDHS